MITVKRTNSDNPDFQKLVKELDIDLSIYYKQEQAFYDELNKIEKIKKTVVIYNELGTPIGCGGVIRFSETEAEVKRMYVPKEYRGKGVAVIVLNELEKWCSELDFEKCILETLKEKPYAIRFYEKNGYIKVPNFGEYISADNSICFEKLISKK